MDATNPLQNFLFIDNYLKLNSALVIEQSIPSRNRILSVYAPLSNADTYVNNSEEIYSPGDSPFNGTYNTTGHLLSFSFYYNLP